MRDGEASPPATLAALWADYQSKVLDPSGMSEDQKSYMRGAYFSGVISTLGFLGGLDDHSDNVAQAMLDAFNNEVAEWAVEYSMEIPSDDGNEARKDS